MVALVSIQASYSSLSSNISTGSRQASDSIGRLSSGKRIIRASDDVANMSVSTRMLSRTTALRSTLTNLSQADSLLQVADSGLQRVEEMLSRMSQLSVMANSGATNKSERAFLNIEFNELKDQIDETANKTTFNGVSLLNGDDLYEIASAFEFDGLTVTGSSDANNLKGSDKNDVISAGEGNDIIEAGAGDDSINAGEGREIIYAGDGNDTIVAAVESVDESGSLPVTNNLVLHIDPQTTSSLTTHPGTVTVADDQSAANNDATAVVGAVLSGSDAINGNNALTFDGASHFTVADTNDINVGAQNERSLMMVFETSDDVTTRQMLYEQGGQVNGFSMYIDGGRLYAASWKGNGGNFNFHMSTEIQANTAYAAGFVFDSAGFQEVRAYLNGEQFGSNTVTQSQNSHIGDIGIGGVDNDTRFFDGGFGGDGARFQGKMGELLNYQGALNTTDVENVQDYLMARWRIAGNTDTIVGGAGIDTAILTDDLLSTTLDGTTGISEVENIILQGNNNEHSLVIDDDYFTAGEGLEGDTLTIDATGNSAGITLRANELDEHRRLEVFAGEGHDSITGSGNGSVLLSYANSQDGINIDLTAGTADGYGNDIIVDIVNVVGSDENDTMAGTLGDDTFIGGAGDDVIIDKIIGDGEIVFDGLVHYIDSSDISSITTHPGTVTTITDQSSGGNNALADTGTVLSGTDVINGENALTFDGNSFLRINNTADINTAASYPERSIFMTLETGDDVTSRQVLFEEGGGTNGFNIYIESGQIYVYGWRASGGTFNHLLGSEVVENTAYTIGFVFDSVTDMQFTGYLNGASMGSLTATLDQAGHSGQIGIGGMNNASKFNGSTTVGGDGLEFTGKIGDLLIYNDALQGDDLENVQNYLLTRRMSGIGGHDIFSGGDGNDTITGGRGDDKIDGGTGEDTAVFSGKIRDYDFIQATNGGLYVVDKRKNADGNDLVTNVEYLQFSDAIISVNSAVDTDSQVAFQIREETEEQFVVRLPNVTTEHLFEDADNLHITTQDAAKEAFQAVDIALQVVIASRAGIGAAQSSVSILTNANTSALQNQTAANAVISETDIAVASTEFSSQVIRYSMSAAIAAQTINLRETLVLDVMNGIALSSLEAASPELEQQAIA